MEIILFDDNKFRIPVILNARNSPTRRRFVEFFTANIQNTNTRKAYTKVAFDFFYWCDKCELGDLSSIQPIHVAMWVEESSKSLSTPTVKLKLAAIRHLLDWMVIGQIIPSNPAASVRGPKYSTKRGKTPILSPTEARTLLNHIGCDYTGWFA